jgi:hypothetical protein
MSDTLAEAVPVTVAVIGAWRIGRGTVNLVRSSGIACQGAALHYMGNTCGNKDWIEKGKIKCQDSKIARHCASRALLGAMQG